MRVPSEYIASALRIIRDRMMPDCACVLTHGDESAKVTRVGNTSRGENELSGEEPSDAVHILALASDFPTMSKGELVNLDGISHVVTSATKGAAGASINIRLSAPINELVIIVATRNDGQDHGGSFSALVERQGYDDPIYEEAVSTRRHVVTVVIPRVGVGAWIDEMQDASPRIGDRITLQDGGIYTVSEVRKETRTYALTAREV